MIRIIFALMTAHAEFKVDITSGRVEPMPIAVTGFFSDNPVGDQMSDVIRNNLKFSGLFRPLEKDASWHEPRTNE